MTTETKATSLHDAIADIPAGLWGCDMNGHPSTDYIPRWKALDIATAHDALVAQLVEALELCRSHMYEHASNTRDGAFDKLCTALAAAHKGER
jgi:hypothetical protein